MSRKVACPEFRLETLCSNHQIQSVNQPITKYKLYKVLQHDDSTLTWYLPVQQECILVRR